MEPMSVPSAGVRREPARSRSSRKGIALGGVRAKNAAATAKRKRGDGDNTGQARQRGDPEPSPHWAANSVFLTLCLPCYDPAKHDWHDAPEGAPDGIRYPTPTGRDEIAEGVAGFCRRNPDGTLQRQPLGVPFLVRHGLVPPSDRQRSIMRGENSGAMGVRDGGSCDQDHPTNLRPGQGGADDAGEGGGGGAQAGSGSEVGEVSVGGDEECGLGGAGGEASGRGVTGTEHDGEETSCTIC